jgi:hypothetical protein
MSEIKFACPQCRQHIACDVAYAGERMECPSCMTTLVVPRLTGSTAKHPDGLLVASRPAPKRSPDSHHPTGDFWIEPEWAQHEAAMPGSEFGQPWTWVLVLLATVPCVALALLGTNSQSRNFALPVGIALGAVSAGLAAWLTYRKSAGSVVLRALFAGFVALGLVGAELSLFAFIGCCTGIG